MKQGKILGSWQDPLGRMIRLEMTAWRHHILKHHPDMAFRLEAVGKTLMRPEEIRREKNDRLYYKRYDDAEGNRYLKVVARLASAHGYDGFIASSYLVEKIENKGALEWRQK